MEKRKIKYQGISTLEVLIEAKNYNQWIADEIKKHVTAPVLEIGAGTGNLTAYFIHNNPFYISEYDEGMVRVLNKKFSNIKGIFINKLDITVKPRGKLLSFFSTVFAINVLEHIKDDEKALRNIYKLLKKNGKLVLLVPAKKIAYTKLDRELGHYRRYEKQELKDKLINAGYHIERLYFFNIVGLISWVVRDKIKRKNFNLKPYHIKIFDSIVPILRLLESIISIPVGISLIVIAKKV